MNPGDEYMQVPYAEAPEPFTAPTKITTEEYEEFRRRWATVKKHGALMPLSAGLLMDEGLIPDTRPARPRRAPVRVTSWSLARDLARMRVRGAWVGVRLRAGSRIAGVDLTEQDDETEEW